MTGEVIYETLQEMRRKQPFIGVIIVVLALACLVWYVQISQKTHSIPMQQTPIPEVQISSTNVRQSNITLFITPPLTGTDTNSIKPLNTQNLTGSYPGIWSYYPLIPSEYENYSVCDTYGEVGHFVKQGGNDVYIAVCPITILDPEKLLLAIAPNGTVSTALKYQPGTAVKSFRFGIEGLKGTWMQGVQGEYVPAYFEIYVKNNQMFLMEALTGYTKDIEDLLSNIALNF